jgi:NAD(P)H-flavin reductase
MQATGNATILVGQDAAEFIARTNVAVRITLSDSIFVPGGLPFKSSAAAVEYSPYNPPLRTLISEGADPALAAGAAPLAIAILTNKEKLTPSIERLTFRLSSTSSPVLWRAGQHMTLDFSAELDHGWSHMRDSDPQSLNDDHVRTFTVSSVPPPHGGDGAEFQITVRRHGPVTTMLSRHNMRGAPLEVEVRGIGGKSDFSMLEPVEGTGAVRRIFVAGGVGITPLLAQAPGLLASGSDFKLVWGLRAEDLALAIDTFEKIPCLAAHTSLLVSGNAGDETEDFAAHLQAQGVASFERRRMEKRDVHDEGQGQKVKYYLCAGPFLLQELRSWLEQEDIVWEDFNY